MYTVQNTDRPSQTVVPRASRRLPSLSIFPASATASLHPFDHRVQPGLLAGSLCDAWINSAGVGFTNCESQTARVGSQPQFSCLGAPPAPLFAEVSLARAVEGVPRSFSGSCHGGRRLPSASLAALPAAQLLHHLLRCCMSVGVVPVVVAVDCLAAAHRSETTRERNQNSPFWQRVLLERTNRSESPARDLDALLPPTAPQWPLRPLRCLNPWPASGEASKSLLALLPARNFITNQRAHVHSHSHSHSQSHSHAHGKLVSPPRAIAGDPLRRFRRPSARACPAAAANTTAAAAPHRNNSGLGFGEQGVRDPGIHCNSLL